MRKRLIAILVISIVALMAYGVTGTGATFRSAVNARDQVEVGTMQITLDGHPQDVTCPSVQISTPDSASPVACDILIDTVGTVTPGKLTVHLAVTGSHPEGPKFSISYSVPGSGMTPAHKLTDKDGQDLFTTGAAPLLPYTLHTLLSWQGLGIASMGQVMNLQLTITETESGS